MERGGEFLDAREMLILERKRFCQSRIEKERERERERERETKMKLSEFR